MMSLSAQAAITKRVYWRGELSQTMSLTLGAELLKDLKDCDMLVLNLAEVEDLDFSCLVLLCAIKRQSSEKGKLLRLEGKENPLVAAVLQKYCHNGNRLCRAYCGNSCLFD